MSLCLFYSLIVSHNMNSFFKSVTSVLSKNKYRLLIGITLLTIVLCYKTCSPKPGTKKEHFQNNSSTNELIVTFYAFDYCGHCTTFKPIWEKAKKQTYPDGVQFRYYDANTLSQSEKESIPYYIDPSYTPNVVLTVNGRNIEFKRQQSIPMDGLDVFIRSKGTKYFK
jgi:thiol-disulfide isomerase/thioredoxin